MGKLLTLVQGLILLEASKKQVKRWEEKSEKREKKRVYAYEYEGVGFLRFFIDGGAFLVNRI